MVCVKCEKKLAVLEPPDKWKDGARNTTKADQRKIGANKLLKGKQNRFNPYDQFNKCKICKTKVHQKHAHYCQGCSYKHGICAMCGKQMIDTKDLKQTN